MSTEFTAKTFRWLHQLNADADLLPVDMKVAVQLTRHFREKDQDGRAYPGCKTIGDAIGLSERTVDRSVRRMHARGHLRVVWGTPGRGHPNQYWMVEKIDEAEKTRTVMRVSTSKKKPRTITRVLAADRKPASGTIKPASEAIKPASGANKTRTAMRENHKNHRNREENQAARALSPDFSKGSAASASMHADSSNGAANKEAFERFWQVYPRQEGKLGAEREFKKVLELSTAEKIIDAARQYAALRAAAIQGGDPPRFTLGPTRWLADGHWANPTNGMVIEQHGNSVAMPTARPGDDIDAEVDAILATGFRINSGKKD